MIEYITLSDLVKKVSQDAVEKGKEIFNTKKIREKYLNIFEIIEKKFSQPVSYTHLTLPTKA